MDYNKSKEIAHKDFEGNIIPSLSEYIKIENVSREYDKDWNTNGLLEKAGKHLLDWSLNQGIKGMKGELIKEEERTPIILMEIEPNSDSKKTVLLYGVNNKIIFSTLIKCQKC